MAFIETSTEAYSLEQHCVFFRTKEQWGGFSNMCGGFPLKVGDIDVRSSEALYQALRYPHLPQAQAEILAEKSPMGSKFASKRYTPLTRPDWDRVRVQAMCYALTVKVSCHFDAMAALFEETGDRQIVERSRKDPFWGAILNESTGILTGQNILGKLLMLFRRDIARRGKEFRRANAPEGSLLLGGLIEPFPPRELQENLPVI